MKKFTKKARSYLQLLIAVAAIIVVQPFLESESTALENLILTIFFLGLLISSIRAVSLKTPGRRSPVLIWSVRIIGTLAFLTDLAGGVAYNHASAFRLLLAISTLSYACLIFLLCIYIVRDIFSGEKVTSDKIYGAVAVYLLIGLLFGCLYVFLNSIVKNGVISTDGRPLTAFSEFIYFSFTTLCTLGYGDIVARTKIAMLFTNLEAITGQLYLTILVARLVSLHLFQDRKYPVPPAHSK